MPFQYKKSGKKGVLTLEGDLTIAQAGELKDLLLESMEKVDQVTIKALDLSEVDLACFQVLCSAHRFFDANKKKISLFPETAEAFRQVVKRSCFSTKEACGMKLNTECFLEED